MDLGLADPWSNQPPWRWARHNGLDRLDLGSDTIV